MGTQTLGIVGGGQLGRMSVLAAARLGISCVVFCPEGASSPAGQVVATTIQGAYDDHEALRRFASLVDVMTYEFENIPLETVAYLSTLKPVHPKAYALEVSQDRAREKAFLNSIDVPTARWVVGEILPMPCILKTLRFGYDGKGQEIVQNQEDIAKSLSALGGAPFICEALVDFACEISVIVARGRDRQMVSYGPMRNEHADGILRCTSMPAGLAGAIETGAIAIAQKIAQSLDLVGVLAVEMFVGKDNQILVNEIAPRPHNSGHWSIDACAVSQFENHVRAVMGLSLAPPYRHSDAVMYNLIGDDSPPPLQDGACLHWYGKREARQGRKMGRLTILSPAKMKG